MKLKVIIRKKSMLLLLPLILALTFSAFPIVRAHTITVDGDPSDWIGIAPVTPNTGTCSEFEYIWTDEVGDDTGNGTYTYPTAAGMFTGGEADLVELRITRDSSYLYFLLTFDDITDNGWLDTAGWLSDPDQAETTTVAICIDFDKVAGSGEALVDDGMDDISADILLPSEALWEYLIEIALDDVVLWLYDGFFIIEAVRNFPCAADTVVYETIEFAVPISHDPYTGLPDYDETWRFFVFIGSQDLMHFREVNAVTSEWNGGGGSDHPYDPDAYDCAFFANKTAQEAVFNGFTDTSYAVVSAYMDIDMNFPTPPPPPVGGTIVPTNKLELLTPYIGVISVILVAITVVVKKRRLNYTEG